MALTLQPSFERFKPFFKLFFTFAINDISLFLSKPYFSSPKLPSLLLQDCLRNIFQLIFPQEIRRGMNPSARYRKNTTNSETARGVWSGSRPHWINQQQRSRRRRRTGGEPGRRHSRDIWRQHPHSYSCHPQNLLLTFILPWYLIAVKWNMKQTRSWTQLDSWSWAF